MKARKAVKRKGLLRDFGSRLRQIRSERNLTQRQLAQLVGCETMLISGYERGMGLPKLDTLVALAEALQVGLDYLALGQTATDAPPAPPVQNILLLQRFKDLETLSREDQAVALKLLDALISSRQMEAAMATSRRVV
jgi:transcriptional regulator with XRE-family HTH domain